jgi:hypothetical protein
MMPGHTSRINSSGETRLGAADELTSGVYLQIAKYVFHRIWAARHALKFTLGYISERRDRTRHGIRHRAGRPELLAMPILTFVWMVTPAETPEHYGASTVRFAILLQRTGLPCNRVDRHIGRHQYVPESTPVHESFGKTSPTLGLTFMRIGACLRNV